MAVGGHGPSFVSVQPPARDVCPDRAGGPGQGCCPGPPGAGAISSAPG
ncbi:hypothetical protein L083_3460 [Actinoplanes sp. N902-109]|nr:hypothetical protein L083_3460 [Actinoplanes sp. N902-109]